MTERDFRLPRGRHPSRLVRYGVAAISTLACAAGWTLLAPHVEFEATLLLFLLPILVATWFGGHGAGAVASALALASAVYLMPFGMSATGLRGEYLDLL